MTQTDLKQQLQNFSKQWEGRGYEKGETQTFWLQLLGILLGRDASDFIRFEEQVHNDLKEDLSEIKQISQLKKRKAAIQGFQQRLGGLQFLENCTTSLIRVAAA